MRKWIKLDTIKYLDGSIRKDLLPAERSVWTDLIVMAGISGDCDGRIERSKGIPYSYEELADRFVVDIELVQSTIEKCINEGRLIIDPTGTLVLTHWDKYQPAFDQTPGDNGRKHATTFPPLVPPLSDYDAELERIGKLAKLTREFPDEAKRLVEEANKTPEFKDMVKNTLREIKK